MQHLGARGVSHVVIDEVHEWNHLTIHILGSALRSKKNFHAIDSVTILGIPTDIASPVKLVKLHEYTRDTSVRDVYYTQRSRKGEVADGRKFEDFIDMIRSRYT